MHLYASKNLNLNIGKTIGYNNKIVISNADMKIGSSKDINNTVYRKKLAVNQAEPGRAESATFKVIKNTHKLIKDDLVAHHDRGCWDDCL